MNVKRLNFIMIGLVGLLFISLAIGTYQADKLLSKRADTLTSLKAVDQALSLEQVHLKKAKKDISKYADLEKIARIVVPEDKNQAEAVRELVNIAASDNVTLGSITFPISTLGTSSAGTVGSGTSTPAQAAPTPTKKSLNSPNNKLSQLLAVKGLPGVYQLTINVTSDTNAPATYDQIIRFLRGLESNRRTAQVTSINLQPVAQATPTGHSRLNFTLTINEYIKP